MACVNSSAYGRAAATRCCAFWMREAAMSSIARVIFLVDSTLRIRRRSARSCPPAISAPSLRRGSCADHEPLLEVAEGGGELVLGERGAAADRRQQIAVPGPHA